MDWVELYERLERDRSDPAAWATLQEQLGHWAKADFSWTEQHAVGEDVVQDACLSVLEGFEKAHGARTFRGFVLGQYFNSRRRALRWVQQGGTAPHPTDEDQPNSQQPYGQAIVGLPGAGPAPDELALIQQCMEDLEPRQRRAVELRFLFDASYAMIANGMDITIVNARQLVWRGLASLRTCVQHAWPLEPLE